MGRVWGIAAGMVALGLMACDDGTVPTGPIVDAFIRDMPVIPAAVCGDGMVEAGEGCDDGNLESGDGCDATCQPEAVCGDGVQAGDEACDDGNTDDGDGCSATCTREATCGDGVLDDNEGCDDGNTADGDGCDAQCRPEPQCGNDTLDDGEECDDGNTENGDGCDADCMLEESDTCGDGALDAGEGCDDGNRDNGDGCDEDCQVEPFCGDGTLDDGEACDDGNRDNGDGCDADCQIEPACGDGTLDDGEGCDDGNRDPGDGCDADCQVEPACGDGVVDDGEECDDGGRAPGDGCSADCTFEDFCGNGIVDPGEACDDGNLDPGDGCDAACQLEPFCGDGTIDDGEACDDGNLDPGDGCDADCQLEPFCGDGTLDDGEACDDGNRAPGDGCDADCQLEPFCGDGTLDPGEECDDGNPDGGDGCDATCVVEPVDISAGGDFPAGFAAGSLDRFVFDVAAASDVVLDTGACGGALRMTLFRRDGDGLIQVAAVADGGCPRVDRALDPGAYVLLVDAPGGAAAQYTLTASFTVIPPPECGNGVLEEGEGCDDGNLADGDGCNAQCVSEACGDGVLQPDEECDHGAADAGCDAECRVITVDISAGGMFDGGFQAGSFDRYTFTLREEADVRLATGDGLGGCPGDLRLVVDLGGGEVARADGAGCGVIDARLPAGDYRLIVDGPAAVDYRLTAAFIPVPQAECGDRQIEADEECDDGNDMAGDGCDACVVEAVDVSAGGQFFGSFVARSLDRYTFTLNTAADVTLTTGDGVGGCPGDTEMRLFDALGAVLEAASDGAIAPCAGLTITLPPGDYSFTVDGADGRAVGAYFLDVTYRYERAPGEPCDPAGEADRCAEPGECRGEPALCRVGDCGDGNQDVGEACDDGNLDVGDGCDALCRVEACGNGRLDAGETCDDGNLDPGDGCDGACNDEHVCGDGDLDPDEACDDGNLDPGDGCDADCQVEPFCGDGNLDPGEECDDGNVDPGDGCDPLCQREPACGDGNLDAGEACDDGNLDDGDGCDANCQIEPFCGDGNLDAGEECDDGNNLGSDGCDPQCVREPQCGDGIVDPNEECDDGNFENGDGCNVVCQLEDPDPVCGDGNLDQATEICDDGNLNPGDGCDSLCTPEVYPLDNAFVREAGGFEANRNDRYTFTVEATATLYVETSDGAGGCPADTIFTLNRVDVPQQIATNDDGGFDVCSLLQLQLVPGDYELIVGGFGGGAVGGYVIDYQLVADISAGGVFGGGFDAGGDDAFVLALDAATAVRIDTTDGAGRCPGDTTIDLYSVDALGQLALVESIEGGGVDPCAAVDRLLDAGTWLLFVSGEGAVPAYALEVGLGACGDGVVTGAELCDDGNQINGDGCDAACTLEAYDLINAEALAIEEVPADATDSYRFVVDDTSFFFATIDDPAGQCPGDTLLVLSRDDGGALVEVDRDDDGGLPGGCSELVINDLAPGEYVLEVSAAAPLTYRLLIFHTVVMNQLGDYAGLIAQGGDDVFSFGLNQATNLTLSTSDGAGGCPADTVMQIFSVDQQGARALVVEDDDGGVDLCSQASRNFGVGNYEVVITGFGGDAVPPYVLTLDAP